MGPQALLSRRPIRGLLSLCDPDACRVRAAQRRAEVGQGLVNRLPLTLPDDEEEGTVSTVSRPRPVGRSNRPASACGPSGSVDSAACAEAGRTRRPTLPAAEHRRGRKQGRSPQARGLEGAASRTRPAEPPRPPA